MSYDALRTGRASLPGYAYFVTTTTARRTPWFRELSLARVVIRELRRADEERHLDTLAWVLMPDHLHWLFQLGDHCTLSEVVKRFKGRSARAVNRLLDRRGRVWQRAFYDRALRDNESPRETARYIVANPVRAGLVERIEEYPFWDAAWL